MPVVIPDSLLQSAQISEADVRLELALTLFQQDRLTLGQAAELASLPQLDFQRVLGSRRIPVHYGSEQLEADVLPVQDLRLG